MAELFQELADNAPVMIWRAGTDKLCDFFNKPWLDFTGRTFQQQLGMGWVETIHPEDRDLCIAEYFEAFDAREEFNMEYRLLHNSGAYRWVLDKGKSFEREGQFAGYIGSAVDIHDRKQMEGARDMMVAELNHRVKNNLSVIQSLIRQTAKRASSKNEMETLLVQRVLGLARAHEVVALHEWQDLSLLVLVKQISRMTAFPERVTMVGDDGTITPQVAESLALTLYEMFLNAIQYGALSNDAGKVALRFSLDTDRSDRLSMNLLWEEIDGPPTHEPSFLGLGLKLMRSFQPKVDPITEFSATGLKCRLTIPLKA